LVPLVLERRFPLAPLAVTILSVSLSKPSVLIKEILVIQPDRRKQINRIML